MNENEWKHGKLSTYPSEHKGSKKTAYGNSNCHKPEQRPVQRINIFILAKQESPYRSTNIREDKDFKMKRTRTNKGN